LSSTAAASPTPGTGGGANAGANGSANADPWALATSGQYDPDKIYTRASDDKGHHTLMHVKVSPMLHGEIRALVQSGKLPMLRTHADIVRDAVIHRMIHYRNMLTAQGIDPGTILSTIETEVREAQLDEIETKTAQWDRLINKLDARLADLVQLGDYDTAWWLIDQNREPEDMTTPFARRLANVIDKHTAVLKSVASRLPVVEDVPWSHQPRARAN